MTPETKVRSAHILLVEDDPADVELTLEALAEGQVRSQLAVVRDGVEALAYLRRQDQHTAAPRPNLILLDLNLPRKDGREVLAEIKADPALKDIPVVVLTTSRSEADIARAYELHANCYIVKPMELARLIEVFRQLEAFWLGVVELPGDGQDAASVASSLASPHPQRLSRVLPATDVGSGQKTSAASPAKAQGKIDRILVVEDNPADADLIQEYLEETGGGAFQVETADRAATGLQRLAFGGIDVLLLDLSLPDSTGIETFRRFREAAPELPILVLTGTNDERLALQAVQEGAQDYLPKGEVEGRLLARSIRYAAERARTEHQLRQSHKMEAVGRLAGGVAHDFNNMLAVITGYTELLLTESDAGSSTHARLQDIRDAAERAAALTRQLLAFGRRQMLRPQVLDLNDVVANLARILQRLLGEDIELIQDLSGELGCVKADPSQLDQVLMNLALNAREAMPYGGRLIIRTRNRAVDASDARRTAGLVPGDYVCLSVLDTGCGMDAETKSRIFEPFFTTKGLGQGSGLGLPAVYGIMGQSGGHVEVESAPGQGTVFHLYLPRHSDTAALRDLERPSLVHGRETILVVDDEELVRGLVATVLRTAGYTVLLASDSATAEAECRRHPGPIHLLLTDVVLPRASGREIAETLTCERPEMRVLFMSGYTDDVVLARRIPGEDIHFIQKPFSPGALTRQVHKILDAVRD